MTCATDAFCVADEPTEPTTAMNFMSDTPIASQTTDATFEADVLEASRQQPIVVDFWAEWCQPCRMLTPILEEVAGEYAGRVRLVKANTDQCPQAAQQFSVSGIPAVFTVSGGQIVDAFTGVLPAEAVREYFARAEQAGLAQQVVALEASDPAAAVSQYQAMIAKTPQDASLQIGLARAALAAGDRELAAEVIERLSARGFLEPEAEKLRARLEIESEASDLDVDQARQQVEGNPQDLQARLHLARVLAATDQHAEALEVALRIVRDDRPGVGEKARELMVDIFRILPDDSPLTSDYRRKLSLLLY